MLLSLLIGGGEGRKINQAVKLLSYMFLGQGFDREITTYSWYFKSGKELIYFISIPINLVAAWFNHFFLFSFPVLCSSWFTPLTLRPSHWCSWSVASAVLWELTEDKSRCKTDLLKASSAPSKDSWGLHIHTGLFLISALSSQGSHLKGD